MIIGSTSATTEEAKRATAATAAEESVETNIFVRAETLLSVKCVKIE